MVNARWTLGVLIMAMAIFAVSDARALTAYVPEGMGASGAAKRCGGSSGSGHQVGCFTLTGVAPDQSMRCGPRRSLIDHIMRPVKTVLDVAWAPVAVVGTVAGGAAEIVADQGILAAAVVNEPYVLLTMPYRDTERLN